MLHYFGYFAAIFIGLSLGTMGGGGSILTVPVLGCLMGVSPVQSTAYSLFVVGSTAAVGASGYFRKGLVLLRPAIVFLVPSLLAVFVVRKALVPALPAVLFRAGGLVFTKDLLGLVAFGGLMVVAATSMIRSARPGEPTPAARQSRPAFNQEHCAGGYRSAAGSSLIAPALPGTPVFDLGEAVKAFQPAGLRAH